MEVNAFLSASSIWQNTNPINICSMMIYHRILIQIKFPMFITQTNEKKKKMKCFRYCSISIWIRPSKHDQNFHHTLCNVFGDTCWSKKYIFETLNKWVSEDDHATCMHLGANTFPYGTIPCQNFFNSTSNQLICDKNDLFWSEFEYKTLLNWFWLIKSTYYQLIAIAKFETFENYDCVSCKF